MMLIDTHAHFYGETLFGRLAVRNAVPRVAHENGRRFMVTPTSRFELGGGFVSLDARLAWMDETGIDRQVMTFPGALGPDVLPAAEAIPIVRDVNDELAAACRAHPARFAALAGLPLADIDASVAELERARRTLGLAGVIIPSNYCDTLARLETLAPILAAADALGAHVMFHPGQRHDESLAPRHYADLTMHRASTIDLHAGITHAVVTLLYADIDARYPGMTVQVVNLGGAFPMLVERMDHVVATRDPGARAPSTMLGRMLFDTASLGPHSLELACAVLGPERIMLGTDYPIFATDTAPRALHDAAIPDADKVTIGGETARALFWPAEIGSRLAASA